MEVLETFLDAMGNTPLVRLHRVASGVKPTILAKLEMLNPGGSVKDRIGLRMIEAAEREGKLKPGGTIVEPTSGNTGHGLAIAAAIRGYRCIFVMPDKMSQEKISLLRAYGAEVVVTPTAVAPESPESYYRVADRLTEEIPGAFQPNQYYNQENPRAHYETTGPEIWKQTEGKIDALVVGVGTGGTISGTGRYLKEQNPNVQVLGVDTVGSVYKYYFEHRELPPADQIHGYLIDGIGEDFMPGCVWWDYIDGIVTIDDKTAYRATMELARKESIFTGSSGGAAAAGARQIAQGLGADGLVVTLLPDSGERYLSKLNKQWLTEKGLFEAGEV